MSTGLDYLGKPSASFRRPQHITTSGYHNLRLSQPQDILTSGYRDLRISRPQDITTSGYINLRVTRPQNITTSGYHNLRISQPQDITTSTNHNLSNYTCGKKSSSVVALSRMQTKKFPMHFQSSINYCHSPPKRYSIEIEWAMAINYSFKTFWDIYWIFLPVKWNIQYDFHKKHKHKID